MQNIQQTFSNRFPRYRRYDSFNASEGDEKETILGVYTWGWGSQGQLGFGDLEARASPLAVSALNHKSVGSITNLACGSRFTVALTTTGDIYTFGKNDDGQLGHGDRQQQSLPRLVEPCPPACLPPCPPACLLAWPLAAWLLGHSFLAGWLAGLLADWLADWLTACAWLVL